MREGVKAFWIGVLVVFGLAIIGLLLKFVFFPIFVAQKTEDAAYQITNSTMNGQNILYNYHWFYQQDNDAVTLAQQYWQAKQAYNNDVSTFPTNKSTWTFQEQQTAQEDETTYQGILQQLDSCVNTYNAHSQEADRGMFKSKNLPQTLSVQQILTANKIPGVK